MELPSDASVLVLLVVTDGARWLSEVLDALRAQDHRPIDVIAVDNASTDGSGDRLVDAFGGRKVITLERRTGYGRALAAGLKVASDRGSKAEAFLLLHDDCALAPGALTAMIDEMRRGGAGIVGPKLVEWDDPTRLQDIGQTTDGNGRVVARIERGELDQGQHEGVHEVLYATSAAMLIHRDVVERVGLFDLRYVVLRDDLDMCWRARLAGFRTVVTTAATARHASAGVRGERGAPLAQRARYFAERNSLATVIKNYSGARLALVLPMAILTSLGSGLLYLVSGRRAAAAQVLEALQWNVVHLFSTLRTRRKAQKVRTVPDADVALLMDRSATRFRGQVERAMEAIAPLDESEPEGSRTSTWVRAHPAAAFGILAAIIYVIGARTVFTSTPLAGVDLPPFPSSWSGFIAEFTSGWRGAARGGAGPATPGLVVLGFFSFLCFGSGWLAERLLLLGMPVVAAITMLRLVRAIGLPRAPARVAVAAYAASPLVLGLFGAGRLPDLILAAAAPGLLLPILRCARVAPSAGWHDLVAGITGLALTASLAPWALPFVAIAGALVALATRSSLVIRRSLVIVAGALVLLFPWSLELFRAGSPLGGGGVEAPARMRELLGLTASVAPVVPWVLSFGIVAAALAGFIIAPEGRRKISSVLGVAAAGAMFVAWAVARGVPWIAPRATLPLTLTAVASCILVAIAYEGARPALRARSFGLRHLVAGVLGVALLLEIGGAGLWVAKGTHRGLTDAGALAPALYASDVPNSGSFRIAWIGGTGTVPTIDITGPEGATAREYLARPAGAAADALRRAVAAIVGGATESGGRLLATFGVRFVVLRPDADATVVQGVARQTDLAFFQRLHGAQIFRDEIGLSIGASVEAPGWVTAASGDLDQAAGAELRAGASAGFVREHGTKYAGRTTARARILLLGEDYSKKWRAVAGGTEFAPFESFGWATRFRVPAKAQHVDIVWRGQGPHRLGILLEILIVVGFGIATSRRAARERGER